MKNSKETIQATRKLLGNTQSWYSVFRIFQGGNYEENYFAVDGGSFVC